MKTSLIAPCGMNCNLCLAHFREKKVCGGCRISEEYRSSHLAKCIILNCDIIKMNNWKYCSHSCDRFPCQRLKNLDKSYRTKYHMSMIENLQYIDANGIRKFIENEKKRWIKEDRIFCVHNSRYYDLN